MTEEERIDRMAELWVAKGGDVEGLDYMWSRLRRSVQDRLHRLPDTWKTPSPQYPHAKLEMWVEDLLLVVFGLAFVATFITLIILCSTKGGC